MGNIGEPERIIEIMPLPEEVPAEPVSEPQPVPEKQPEPEEVPA
jgi:hypothetical protein